MAEIRSVLARLGRKALRSYALRAVGRGLRDFSRNRGSTCAAAVSYYVFFSIFPLLSFVVSALSFFIRDRDAQADLVNALVSQLTRSETLREQIIEAVLGVSRTGTGLLGLASLAATAFSAGAMFGALRQALNVAFDAPADRPYVRGKLLDLVSVVVIPLLILLSLASSAALAFARAASHEIVSGFALELAWLVAYFILPYMFSLSVFFLLYKILPNRAVGNREALTAALTAALGFEGAKQGFAVYVSNFGRYQEVYGALGGVVALLFFIYVASALVILSAEVASELFKEASRPAG